MARMAVMPPLPQPPLKGPLFVIGKRDGDSTRRRTAINDRGAHPKTWKWRIEVMHERSECVCENSYRVWSVEGSTEGTSQGAEPRGMSPRLIPTHDTRGGIAHTLEHMSESIIISLWSAATGEAGFRRSRLPAKPVAGEAGCRRRSRMSSYAPRRMRMSSYAPRIPTYASRLSFLAAPAT